jgi:L-rhamnose isomerase/sugar isomerase
MKIKNSEIFSINEIKLNDHRLKIDYFKSNIESLGISFDNLINKIKDFSIAIPSWALGAGGTRFGRFSQGGEPSDLYQKISDIGIIQSLTKSAGSISLHIPWDLPDNADLVREFAMEHDIVFDAMNSNTFQDQKAQKYSYKYGSLCHTDKNVRQQAIAHNIEVINFGKQLGSKAITVWLADGSNFPGQIDFSRALENTIGSLKEIYKELPQDWKILIEYKPYEPNFYSMVIPDWGTSFMIANDLGSNAFTLVDLGHHLPNTNIEQIVATLFYKGKLGGFHFNDSKYGDDDLTVGSIRPYQLFLLFIELVKGMQNNSSSNPNPAWMIDASHNIKDPLEDLLMSLEAIKTAYAKALLVDYQKLYEAQSDNDTITAELILKNAFETDVRPLLSESRLISGGAIDPIGAYRKLKIREKLIAVRGSNILATGL